MKTSNTNIIPFDKCKNGYLYKINGRNADIGIFCKDLHGFIILRHKNEIEFLEDEYHCDVSEDFGTAHPSEEIEFFGNINENYDDNYDNDNEEYQKIFNYLSKKEEIL